MKKSKRLISLFLSALLAVSVLFIGVSAEDKYAAGDLISFGTYPQSMVTDEKLIAELNSLPLDWVSYGYYYCVPFYTNESTTPDPHIENSEQKDWMKYVDVEYGGEKYRGVLIEKYRHLLNPYQGITSQKILGYELNKAYWFKYEPLVWRIVDPDEGLLISEYVIDAQQINEQYFFNNAYDVAASPKGNLDNFDERIITHYSDYSQSTLRDWLNTTFVDTAFVDSEQAMLISRELDNRVTDFSGEVVEDEVIYSNSYQTTNDEVSLLSVKEFSDYQDVFGDLKAYSTDYSYSQGRLADTYAWTLRTPMYRTFYLTKLHNVDPEYDCCENCLPLYVLEEDQDTPYPCESCYLIKHNGSLELFFRFPHYDL